MDAVTIHRTTRVDTANNLQRYPESLYSFALSNVSSDSSISYNNFNTEVKVTLPQFCNSGSIASCSGDGVGLGGGGESSSFATFVLTAGKLFLTMDSDVTSDYSMAHNPANKVTMTAASSEKPPG